jgi:DNA-damage-inducible protein D
MLEMVAVDGVLRLAQSVESPRAERVRMWLAESGRQRWEEAANPELAMVRVRREYEQKGLDRGWIDKRLRGMSARQELTSEWARRGVAESEEYRALTNRLMESAFGMDVETYRRSKHLMGAAQNLRDHMSDLELVLTTLGEAAATALHRAHGSRGFDELLKDVEEAGEVAATTRAAFNRRAGRTRSIREAV